MSTPALMSIGMFSRATLLSVKQLRRYHEQGVLVPAAVDPVSGYRLYDVAQIHDAAVVARLRELDLPLAQVARVIAARDPDVTRDVLSSHENALRIERERIERAIVELQETVASRVHTPIHLDVFEPVDVLQITESVPHEDFGEFLDAAYDEIESCAAAAGLAITGASMAEYPAQVSEVEQIAALVPVSAAGAVSGRVRNRRLGRTTCAVAVHHGAYEQFDQTYGQLGAWVARNAVDAGETIIERYLVDPCRATAPDELRTEIWWPVRSTEVEAKRWH